MPLPHSPPCIRRSPCRRRLAPHGSAKGFPVRRQVPWRTLCFVLVKIRKQAFDEGRFRRIARRHNGFSVFGENGVELLRRFVFGGKLANHWPLTTSYSNATDFFKKFLEEAFIYRRFSLAHFNEDLQKSHNLCENSIYKQCGACSKIKFLFKMAFRWRGGGHSPRHCRF